MLDFLSLRLFEGISVPLSFWHHALRLAKTERKNRPQMPMAKTERKNRPQMPMAKKERKNRPQMPMAKTERKNRPQMPMAKKERKNRPQMPMAKKERTGHKCLWQRKKDQTTNDGGKRQIFFLSFSAKPHCNLQQTNPYSKINLNVYIIYFMNVWQQLCFVSDEACCAPPPPPPPSFSPSSSLLLLFSNVYVYICNSFSFGSEIA